MKGRIGILALFAMIIGRGDAQGDDTEPVLLRTSATKVGTDNTFYKCPILQCE